MRGLIINPGSGPVPGATEENAIENIKRFIRDCDYDDWMRRSEDDYGKGRFCFYIMKGGKSHEIQMPGLHLGKVRYLGEPGQNIWDFPRLYVDGSSWVWKYAVSVIVKGDEEEDEERDGTDEE